MSWRAVRPFRARLERPELCENWGIFKCHKWGELLRHSQSLIKQVGLHLAPLQLKQPVCLVLVGVLHRWRDQLRGVLAEVLQTTTHPLATGQRVDVVRPIRDHGHEAFKLSS